MTQESLFIRRVYHCVYQEIVKYWRFNIGDNIGEIHIGDSMDHSRKWKDRSIFFSFLLIIILSKKKQKKKKNRPH